MMALSPKIAAMAGTLIDRSADLTNDHAAIMCLIRAGYDAREVGELLDLVIARARRMREAYEALTLDTQMRLIADIMGGGHDQA